MYYKIIIDNQYCINLNNNCLSLIQEQTNSNFSYTSGVSFQYNPPASSLQMKILTRSSLLLINTLRDKLESSMNCMDFRSYRFEMSCVLLKELDDYYSSLYGDLMISETIFSDCFVKSIDIDNNDTTRMEIAFNYFNTVNYF